MVEARTANGLPFPENIRFEDTDQNEIPTEIDGNIARLTITGVGDQVAYPIYAVETGDTVKLAGKLNIVSYDPKPINLVVVPVNGALYPYPENSLRTKLKAIFKPAIDSLSLTLADNFATNEFDGELDEINTNLAQSYTREMKDLFQNFKDKNEILDDTYYIFLLPRFAETDQLGYMPRKRKFGFVNHEQLNAKEEEYVKTIAHELSHGAFVLHHTFVQHPQLVDNPTQNLLDNSKTGTILHKYQWDAVHNPSKAWVLFDEDEERANMAEEDAYEDYEYLEKILQIIRCAYANGEDEIDMPSKLRKGGTDVRVVGFNYGLTPEAGVINGDKVNDLEWTVEDKTIPTISGIQTAIIDESTGIINFTNFRLKIIAPHTNGDGITPFEHFRQYLFPTSQSLTEEFETVWINSGIQAKVTNNESLDSDDIRLLRKISNCGLERLDSQVKLNLIKAILDYPFWFTEHYEDLVLDIIATTSTDAPAKTLYELIFQDLDLVNELFDKMHDTGGEKNFARLGIELMILYENGFSKEEKDQKYEECVEDPNQNREDNRYYFYGFNLGLCDWDISGEKEGNTLTLTEETITATRPFFDVNSMVYRTHCDVDYESHNFELDEIIAVVFPDEGVKMIPALSYYIFIKSKNNQDLRDQLEITFTIITTITPFDEFYFLGKALQLARNPIKALNFVKAKAITKTKKLKVARNEEGTALQQSSAGKIDEMVDFVEPFDISLFQQKYPNLTATNFQGLDEISDFQKLLDDDIASVINNFPSTKQADFFDDIKSSSGISNGIGKNLSTLRSNEINAWEVLSESDDIASILVRKKTKNLSIVDEYMVEYPERVGDIRTNFSQATDKQQYVDNLLGPAPNGTRDLKHRVKELYNDLNENNPPSGWSENLNIDGSKKICSTTANVNSIVSFFERIYDQSKSELIFSVARIPDNSLKWINVSTTPLVTGEGIPLNMLATLRQMKKMKIPDGSLTSLKMSTIQNIKTMLWMSKLMKTNGWNNISQIPSDLIMNVNSINYSTRIMKQAGYNASNARLVENYGSGLNFTKTTFGQLIDNPPNNFLKVTESDLIQAGLTRNDDAYYNFNIFFDLTSF